ALGAAWRPLLLMLPVLAVAAGASLLQACLGAAGASFTSKPRTRLARLGHGALTAALHCLQPLARLVGRVEHGLTPWRRRGVVGLLTVALGVRKLREAGYSMAAVLSTVKQQARES